MLPDPKLRPLLNIAEVIEMLPLGRSTVYAAIRAGEIPSIRIGRRLLIPTAALCELVGLAPEDLAETAGTAVHQPFPPVQVNP